MLMSLTKKILVPASSVFTVDRTGRLQDVMATNMKESKLAKVAIETIKNGPKWSPAQQNGRMVNEYRLQPVTFENSK